MSADNRICILRVGKFSWAVWHGSASCFYHEPGYSAEHFHSEKLAMSRALEMAKEVEEHGYLEYGVQMITKEEQAEGLLQSIRYNEERLTRLMNTGEQFVIIAE